MSKQLLSAEKYIRTKARQLPFHECFVNEDWEASGIANILISKKMPGGNFIIGTFLIDTFCLGLKDCYFQFNLLESEYKEFYDHYLEGHDTIIEIDVPFTHNLIYGAIDYSTELGFKPHKDFAIAEFLLDPDLINDGIDEIEFGKDGKPFYVAGPYDNTKQILGILNRSVGEGNYIMIAEPMQ